MRRTAAPASRRFSNFRTSPPSNRITATASDTMGRNNSLLPLLNTFSGFSRGSPKTTVHNGPTAKPANAISTMAGACIRQATHCAPIPSAPIRAQAKISSLDPADASAKLNWSIKAPFRGAFCPSGDQKTRLEPRLCHQQSQIRSRGYHSRLPCSVRYGRRTRAGYAGKDVHRMVQDQRLSAAG